MDKITQAKILIVDDEPVNVLLLQVILAQSNYGNIVSTSDSRQAVSLFKAIQPDLLLLDLAMPHVDGLAILRELTPETRRHVPILVLTADASKDARHQALSEGADDFITKPFDNTEVALRIKNLLRTRLATSFLEEAVAARTSELRSSQLETVQRLAIAAEYRDDQTGRHAARVGAVSALIAMRLGHALPDIEMLRQAATLHDVGKIGVPDELLLKPGRLTAAEFETMKQHTLIGARILSGSSSPFLNLAESIAHYHHERWDGNGYWGLRGDEIPIAARIVAVADSYDAMVHERPYKAAMPVEDALAEIESLRGRQFDPVVAEAFLTEKSNALQMC